MKYGIGIFVLGLFVSSTAMAGNIANVTNSFTSGTPARAGEVNENFGELVTEINGNANDVTSNAGNISGNTTDIGNNTINIGDNTTDIVNNTGNISGNTTDIGIINTQMPGAIANTSGTLGNFTSTITNIKSLAVPAPGSGMIIFSASGLMSLRSHINGTDSQASCTISLANNTMENPTSYIVIPGAMPTFSTTAGWVTPLGLVRTVSVDAAGSVTAYLNCQKNAGGGASDGFVQYTNMVGVFVPNKY